jgi:hypothetical protein
LEFLICRTKLLPSGLLTFIELLQSVEIVRENQQIVLALVEPFDEFVAFAGGEERPDYA